MTLELIVVAELSRLIPSYDTLNGEPDKDNVEYWIEHFKPQFKPLVIENPDGSREHRYLVCRQFEKGEDKVLGRDGKVWWHGRTVSSTTDQVLN